MDKHNISHKHMPRVLYMRFGLRSVPSSLMCITSISFCVRRFCIQANTGESMCGQSEIYSTHKLRFDVRWSWHFETRFFVVFFFCSTTKIKWTKNRRENMRKRNNGSINWKLLQEMYNIFFQNTDFKVAHFTSIPAIVQWNVFKWIHITNIN